MKIFRLCFDLLGELIIITKFIFLIFTTKNKNMQNSCTNCPSPLPSTGFFCSNCATQFKCRNCNELLQKDAKFCIECGFVIKSNSGSNATFMNTIKFSETKTTRNFEAIFTDTVGSNVSAAFGQIILSKGLPQKNTFKPKFDNSNVLDADVELIEESDNVLQEEIAKLPESSELSKIRQIFRFDGDKAILLQPKLKATSKANYSQRLTLIFLYAKKIIGKDLILRSDLVQLLEDANVFDGNTRSWLAKNDYLRQDKDTHTIELNIPGTEKAKEYLEEVLDSNIENKWSITTQSKTRKKNKNNTDSEINE